jgi:hypothetical protein
MDDQTPSCDQTRDLPAIDYPTQEDVIDLLTDNAPAGGQLDLDIPCVHRFWPRKLS